MSRTLEAPEDKYDAPGNHPLNESRKLLALNDFRMGDVYHGMRNVAWATSGNLPEVLPNDRVIVHYSQNRELFHKQMEELASELDALGL